MKNNELLYYSTLRKIAAADTPKYLRRFSGEAYGLSYEEALEMAYENLISEAKSAVHGKRRPIEPTKYCVRDLGHKGK